MMRCDVRGLGKHGVTSVELPGTGPRGEPVMLSALHERITAISGIPAAQQILVANGRVLYAKDAALALVSCLDKSSRDAHLVRNVRTRGYPSFSLRMSVWRARCFTYCGGALATLSACCVLWQTLAGAPSLRRALPLSDSALSPLVNGITVPLLVLMASAMGAAANLGHWVAGFPILPAALFTLINKGAQQSEAAASSPGSAMSLGRMEMRLAKFSDMRQCARILRGYHFH